MYTVHCIQRVTLPKDFLIFQQRKDTPTFLNIHFYNIKVNALIVSLPFTITYGVDWQTMWIRQNIIR